MNRTWTKYGIVVALAFVVAAPAIALTQGPAARGPRAEERGSRLPGGGPSVAEQEGRHARAASMAGRGRVGRSRRPGRLPGAAGRRLRARRAGPARAAMATRALARADELGLTDTQREDVRAALRAYREAGITRRAESQIGALELGDLLHAGDADLAAVEQKLQELSTMRIAGQIAGLQLDRDVAGMLTAEQIEALAAVDDVGPRRGRRPERPPSAPSGRTAPAPQAR